MRVDGKVELERGRIEIIQRDLHFKLEKACFSVFIAFVCIIVNDSRSLFCCLYNYIRTQLHHDFNMP